MKIRNLIILLGLFTLPAAAMGMEGKKGVKRKAEEPAQELNEFDIEETLKNAVDENADLEQANRFLKKQVKRLAKKARLRKDQLEETAQELEKAQAQNRTSQAAIAQALKIRIAYEQQLSEQQKKEKALRLQIIKNNEADVRKNQEIAALKQQVQTLNQKVVATQSKMMEVDKTAQKTLTHTAVAFSDRLTVKDKEIETLKEQLASVKARAEFADGNKDSLNHMYM